MKKIGVLTLALTVLLGVQCVKSGIAQSASLRLDKANFTQGEEIRVRFIAPGGLPDDAWVGIIPSNVPHGSESENDRHDLTYQYLKGRTSGVLVFQAPTRPGSYDFRMHDTDHNGSEVASVSFVVK